MPLERTPLLSKSRSAFSQKLCTVDEKFVMLCRNRLPCSSVKTSVAPGNGSKRKQADLPPCCLQASPAKERKTVSIVLRRIIVGQIHRLQVWSSASEASTIVNSFRAASQIICSLSVKVMINDLFVLSSFAPITANCRSGPSVPLPIFWNDDLTSHNLPLSPITCGTYSNGPINPQPFIIKSLNLPFERRKIKI